MKTGDLEQSTGVIVGRFQVPVLHEEHTRLIDLVCKKHKKVIVFLGVPRTLHTRRNPLDFPARKAMIQEKYPTVMVLPIPNQRDDKAWSNDLDSRIREVVPLGPVVLYGGRDSFIKPYSGRNPSVEMESETFLSGTAIRNAMTHDVGTDRAWRSGVIHAAFNRYPAVFPTIDAAIVKDDKLLLVRKPKEEQYRFVGGFVDPSDSHMEATVRREVYEETRLSVDGIQYISSCSIDDWRYRDEVDKIMTTFFLAQYQSGGVEPNDDVEEARWFTIEEFAKTYTTILVPEHHLLGFAFLNYPYAKAKLNPEELADEITIALKKWQDDERKIIING